MKWLLALCLVGAASGWSLLDFLGSDKPDIRTDLHLWNPELIHYINNLGSTWKAGTNRFWRGPSRSVIRGMMGVRHMARDPETPAPLSNTRFLHLDIPDTFDSRTVGSHSLGPSRSVIRGGMMGVRHMARDPETPAPLSNTRFLHLDVPDTFDSRTAWPACSSISLIRDQSACGSCWAFGAVEAMSDRVCIGSGGKQQPTLSADDLLSCCSRCGFGLVLLGLRGGGGHVRPRLHRERGQAAAHPLRRRPPQLLQPLWLRVGPAGPSGRWRPCPTASASGAGASSSPPSPPTTSSAAAAAVASGWSCWAFGAVEAMSDRVCIGSGGKQQPTLSADDLLSCCSRCGFGCEGGEPMEAWHYWVDNGIVTGSNFTAHQGCRPYPFPPCEHHNNQTRFKPCNHNLYHTPKCVQKCNASSLDYNSEKFYGSKAYAIESTVEAIQKEIMTHGPVEAAFTVYEDLLLYKSGVYQHHAGTPEGGHAIRILGWGVEKGTPYWLIANSWNTDWGDKGYFKILRGSNECGIEDGVVAGLAKVNHTPKKKHHHHHHRH